MQLTATKATTSTRTITSQSFDCLKAFVGKIFDLSSLDVVQKIPTSKVVEPSENAEVEQSESDTTQKSAHSKSENLDTKLSTESSVEEEGGAIPPENKSEESEGGVENDVKKDSEKALMNEVKRKADIAVAVKGEGEAVSYGQQTGETKTIITTQATAADETTSTSSTSTATTTTTEVLCVHNAVTISRKPDMNYRCFSDGVFCWCCIVLVLRCVFWCCSCG
jgi:hypothetical protein